MLQSSRAFIRQFWVGFFTALCLCSVMLTTTRWVHYSITAAPINPSRVFFPCLHNAFPMQGDRSIYHSLKFLPPPAECKVQGFVIEELEPELNYRRPYALGHSEAHDDRTLLLPYLRAFQDLSLRQRPRRVLLDLGAGSFQYSLEWFLRWYPLDFTEIYAFESEPGVCEPPFLPGVPLEDLYTQLDLKSNFSHWGRVPLPNWAISRINIYQSFMTAKNSSVQPKAGLKSNITHYILEELSLTEDDAVIVKMDIEGEEWDILQEWSTIPDLPYIVDEIFVQVYYNHSTMSTFNWTNTEHTREESLQLLTRLRQKDFFIHYWP